MAGPDGWANGLLGQRVKACEIRPGKIDGAPGQPEG